MHIYKTSTNQMNNNVSVLYLCTIKARAVEHLVSAHILHVCFSVHVYAVFVTERHSHAFYTHTHTEGWVWARISVSICGATVFGQKSSAALCGVNMITVNMPSVKAHWCLYSVRTHTERFSFRQNDAHWQNHMYSVSTHRSYGHMCHMLCNSSSVTASHMRTEFCIFEWLHVLVVLILKQASLIKKTTCLSAEKVQIPQWSIYWRQFWKRKPNPQLSALLHLSLLHLIVLIHLPDVKTGN